MILVKALLLLFWLILAPISVGVCLSDKNEKVAVLGKSYMMGIIVMFTIFELIALLFIFTGQSLNALVYTFQIAVAIIILLNILFFKQHFLNLIRNICKTPTFKLNLMCILALLLVAYQVFRAVTSMTNDDDDAFYVGTAVVSIEHNSMFKIDVYTGIDYARIPSRYVLSPFPIFLAVISKIVSIHPTIVAHTIFPAVFISMAYLVYYLISTKLFKTTTNRWTFVFFMAILNIFGEFSRFSPARMMLVRIWQGKALLSSVLLPFVLYICVTIFENKEWTKKRKNYIILISLILSCCLVSSMGIMLTPILLMCFAVSYAIRHKNISTIFCLLLCMIPNLILGVAYILLKTGGTVL